MIFPFSGHQNPDFELGHVLIMSVLDLSLVVYAKFNFKIFLHGKLHKVRQCAWVIHLASPHASKVAGLQ